MKNAITIGLAALLIVAAVPMEASGAFRGTFRDAPAGGGGGGGVDNPMTADLDQGGFDFVDNTDGEVGISGDFSVSGESNFFDEINMQVNRIVELTGLLFNGGANIFPNELQQAERTTGPTATAGEGKYWVRDDVPNTPMFTDDGGTEHVLNAGGVHPTSTDTAIARYSGTGGDLQDSGVKIGPTDLVTGVAGLTMAAAGNSIKLLDDGRLRFGSISTPDVNMLHDTTQTPDALVLTTPPDSNLLILLENTDLGTDIGRGARPDPTLRIQSGDITTTTEAVEIHHNKTDAIIDSPGAGKMSVRATGGGGIELFSPATAASTFAYLAALDGNGNDADDWGDVTFRSSKGLNSIHGADFTERVSAPTVGAGHGSLHVLNTTPSSLHYVDDAANDLNISGLNSDFLLSFNANQVVFPATSAQAGSRNSHSTLDFNDADPDESVVYEGVMPSQYRSGSLTVSLFFTCNTATTGDVVWEVAFEAMPPDVLDLDADSFAAVQSVTDTCAGVAGRQSKADITFTRIQADSIDPGTPLRIKATRNADVAGPDTLVGDANLVRALVTQ